MRTVLIGGVHPLQLHPARAAFCPQTHAVMVADVHLGKARTFRMLGVPVPEGVTASTLARLDRVLKDFPQAESIFILGDLLHSRAALVPELLTQLSHWRQQHGGVRVVLVRGNHDHSSGDPPDSCGIEVVAAGYRLGPWRLTHEPAISQNNGLIVSNHLLSEGHLAMAAEGWELSGHLHPCYTITGRADRVRLPAFWMHASGMVLPAFGEFTGGMRPAYAPADQVFVTDGEVVTEAPRALARLRQPERA